MIWKRILTAIVLVPSVTALVLLGSTGAVAIGVAALMQAALFEYFALGAEVGHRAYRFWTATCALLLVYVQWLSATYVRAYPLAGQAAIYESVRGYLLAGPPQLADVFVLFVLGIGVLSIFTRRPLVEALPAAGISASGLLLVGFPLSFAIRLHGAGQFGPRLLLFALVIVWVGDTLAYFVGRSIGRMKLAPKLSPQKTWEGAVASVLGSLLVGLAFARWLPVDPGHLLAMAAVGNVAGQMGDLLESAYKRSAGVKDSGGLLPGHGGVLDRIDALILAIPVVWYYWHLVFARLD
jgi:phosphatidate cytidylyltransferase